MEVIFLIGSIQSFFLTIVLLNKKNKKQADIFLSLIFACFGLVLLDNYFRNTGFYNQNPHLIGVTYCIPMLIGPLFYIYAYLLIKKGARFKKTDFLHALPFLIFVTYFFNTFYLLTGPEKIKFFREVGRDPSFMIYAAESLLIFSAPVYFILILFLLRKHSKNLKENYSYTEKINLNWLRLILICTIVLTIISFATNLFSDVIPLIPYWVGDNIFFTGLTVLVFFLGYYGIQQAEIYKGISLEEARNTLERHAVDDRHEKGKPKLDHANTDKYKKSGLHSEDADRYLEIILQYMEQHKPYLETKLSIKMLSEAIEISTNHISQVINEKLKLNFFDFINGYRVEEVKKCLTDPSYEHYTLLGIAFECGFNAKSSFNSIFKKSTGLTPTEFQKSLSA